MLIKQLNMSGASLFCAGCCLLIGLAGCGTKPDGTPYGVNSAKHPDGHLRTDSTPGNTYTTGTGMPKGAEMNAVSSGMTAGQPTHPMSR